jgi:CYTH domain-containing protein
VEHSDAPPGKARKYARPERERRFLMELIPPGPCIRRAEIVDRYLKGTRMRLRRTIETTADGTVTIRKLTQKLPAPDGSPGLLTTFYLSEAEYEVVASLTADVLRKIRYSLPPLGVDIFQGSLEGLVLAEVELESDTDLIGFDPPRGARAEVTRDLRFTGGRLVTTDAPSLLSLLAEFGLDASMDTSELARRPLTSWPSTIGW